MTPKDPVREDFRNFLFLAWDALGLPEPAPIQYDVATWVQHGPRRMMVTAMRGFGKSYITAAFAAWRLYCDPNTTILCVSASSVRAREFVRLTRKLLELIPCCAHLVPREGDRDGADRFDCGARTSAAKDPSIAAYGITAMITGTHVDIIIPDDIETPDNSITVEARDKLFTKCLEFESILVPGAGGKTRIIYLGTPHHEDSIYLKLREHYTLRKWPARYPDPAIETACDDVAPYLLDKVYDDNSLAGESSYPEYYPEDELLGKEAVMGPSVFAMQMLLDTTLSDADRYPLKLSDFMVFPVAPDIAPTRMVWASAKVYQGAASVGIGTDRFYEPMYWDDTMEKYQESVMFVDPSGHGKDETGYAIGKLLNGMIFVPAAGGLPGGYADVVLEKLAKLARDWNVQKIICESNFGDGMFESLLTPIVGRIAGSVAIESLRVAGQKEMRLLDWIEPPMAQHRIVIDPRVAKDQTLMQQLTRLTRERGCLRHDDRIEALAGCIGYFADKLLVDIDNIKMSAERAEMIKQTKEFYASIKKGGGLNRLAVTGAVPVKGYWAGSKPKKTRRGQSRGDVLRPWKR